MYDLNEQDIELFEQEIELFEQEINLLLFCINRKWNSEKFKPVLMIYINAFQTYSLSLEWPTKEVGSK